MINKVTLIGYLGKDPEIRHLESGSVVGKFSIATSENYKDKAGEWQTLTEWHDIVVWRGLAEKVERDLKKGSLCYVDGKLTHRKYQDKEGNDKYITEVVANNVRLLEKRAATDKTYDNFPSETPNSIGAPAAENPAKVESPAANTTVDEDDLPF